MALKVVLPNLLEPAPGQNIAIGDVKVKLAVIMTSLPGLLSPFDADGHAVELPWHDDTGLHVTWFAVPLFGVNVTFNELELIPGAAAAMVSAIFPTFVAQDEQVLPP